MDAKLLIALVRNGARLTDIVGNHVGVGTKAARTKENVLGRNVNLGTVSLLGQGTNNRTLIVHNQLRSARLSHEAAALFGERLSNKGVHARTNALVHDATDRCL